MICQIFFWWWSSLRGGATRIDSPLKHRINFPLLLCCCCLRRRAFTVKPAIIEFLVLSLKNTFLPSSNWYLDWVGCQICLFSNVTLSKCIKQFSCHLTSKWPQKLNIPILCHSYYSMAIQFRFFGIHGKLANVTKSSWLHLAMVSSSRINILSSFVQLRRILALKHRSC